MDKLFDVHKWWHEKFLEYAATIARLYKNDKEKVTNDLRFDSVLACLNESYQALIKDGSLPTLESLTLEKKTEIWDRAIKVAKDKKRRILISRAIYLLEKITE